MSRPFLLFRFSRMSHDGLIRLLVLSGIFLIFVGMVWAFEKYPAITAEGRFSIMMSFALVLFSAMTWFTYEKIAKLADLQNEIAKNNFWVTDELQSNAKTELILRANELGIPVMYWDPNKETWDPNLQPWHTGRSHRKIAQMPVVIMPIPKHERMDVPEWYIPQPAKPFSTSELNAIKKEHKRLQKLNSQRKRTRGAK